MKEKHSSSPSSLILASASPRRAELLRQIGVSFETLAADIDETPKPAENPEDYVLRMALEKARAVSLLQPDAWVLGSDTAVIAKGEAAEWIILGKPVDQQDAYRMWHLLSGETHKVLTSVALVGPQLEGGITKTAMSVNLVSMNTIPELSMKRYWLTGEPKDKAGAYAVQGKAALWIERIEGSYSSIMGLPVFETGELLEQAGFSLW